MISNLKHGTDRRQGAPLSRLVAGVAVAALLSAGIVTSASPAVALPDELDVTELVDTFVSTEDDFGQDLPGAQAPNSLVKINPMTTPGRSHSGYDYAESKIAGFTHTNLDGVGGSGGGGDLLVVPTYVTYTSRPSTTSYAKSYSHDSELAEPGYYGVDLTTTTGKDGEIANAAGVGPILAEATTDVRTGQDRFTFPKAGAASLVVDLRNNFTRRIDANMDVTTLSDGRAALAGRFSGYFNGYDYEMYYYLETTAAVKGVRTWGQGGALGAATHHEGSDIGAILDFDVAADDQVGVKVAISPISSEQARKDLGAEMGARTFDQVRADTSAAWEALLARLAVTATDTSDPDGSLRKLFYTHLYRLFAVPMNATSTSGTYRGLDGAIREADGYTHYDGWAMWDDFRKYSILAVGYPDIYADMAQSLVDLYATFTDSGKGSLSSMKHAVPTVRFERSAVVIADAIAKGAKLRRLESAWPGLVKASNGRYNAVNEELGYIPVGVADTLGTAYDDWAMATIAGSMGKSQEAERYRVRATNWTNTFKDDVVELDDGSKVGLVMSRNADGSWVDVNPERFEPSGAYQGTLWQYNWYTANDMGGIIEKTGGKDRALAALSYMFGEHDPDNGSRMLHSNANEIDLQAPYLFNYVGAPSHTQYWARSIYTKDTWNRYIATGSTHEAPSGGGEFNPPVKTKVFKLEPQGFLPTMDNDAGTMSATYVAAALGLFPVLAGSDEYQIGSPFFEKVSINYPSGRTFDITANGVSPDRYYVQSATLNGRSFDRTWVTYDQMLAGGELKFTMGEDPSDWAADGVSATSLSDVMPSSIYDRDSAISVSRREFVEAAAGDGSVATTITAALTDGAFSGMDGDDLAASKAITSKNVPEGLTLVAARTGPRTMDLSLTGKAKSSDALDSIDNLEITFTDTAFLGTQPEGTRTFTTKVSFAGATIAAEKTSFVASPDGAVDSATALSLRGGAFAGADGRDLIAEGALALPGLPGGITASAIKQDATTIKLRLVGSLGTARRAEFSLGFTDGAFAGIAAAAVAGDGISTLSRFTISIDQRWRERLAALYEEAALVVPGAYSATTFAAFSVARDAARDALDNSDASDEVLQAAWTRLSSAIGGLQIVESPYRVLQTENYDTWSGGGLKIESGTDSSGVGLRNLGGVVPGSWIAYEGLRFEDDLPEGFAFRYVNNSNRSAPDSRVEIRLNAPDGPLAGTVALPPTGASWNYYTVVDHELADPSVFEGSPTVYFVFEGTVTGSRPWLVNADWAQFTQTNIEVPISPVRIESESYTGNNGGGIKKETGTDSTGAAIGNVGGTWNGGQIVFDEVNLGTDPLDTLTVRYANNSSRTGPNAALDFYLDQKGAGAEPFVTVPLSPTGTAWNAYETVTVALPSQVVGKHKLLVDMRADTTGSLPYVSNLDWFEFGPSATRPVDTAELRAAVENATRLLAERDRYIGIDFAVFESALNDAVAVLGSPSPTAGQVSEALRKLTLAQGQLEWKVVRLLPALIVQAEAVDRGKYTPASVAALDDALAAAKAIRVDASYEAYIVVYDGLAAALDGLRLPAATTTVTLESSASTVLVGGSIELTATLTPSDAIGEMRFFEGATPVGSAAVTDGKAAVRVAANAVGRLEFTATYVPTDPASFTESKSAAVFVIVSENPVELRASIRLSASSVAPGAQLSVEGEQFAPGEVINVVLHSTPVRLGTGLVGMDGTFGLSVVVPSDVPLGQHRVVVTGVDSGLVAEAGLNVVASEKPSPVPGDDGSESGLLQVTGVGGLFLAAAIGILLVLAGGVLWSRRRSGAGMMADA